jgi:hypothetical protein
MGTVWDVRKYETRKQMEYSRERIRATRLHLTLAYTATANRAIAGFVITERKES